MATATCIYCGYAIVHGYQSSIDTAAAHQRLIDHDRQCPKNPLVDRIKELEAERLYHYDLTAHLFRQIAFSTRAFGPGDRAQGVIDHIRKELLEVEAEPEDLEEWIDVVLLALDGAWRAGYHPDQVTSALEQKLAKNEQRHWPDWRTADRTKAIEHDRAAERQGGETS